MLYVLRIDRTSEPLIIFKSLKLSVSDLSKIQNFNSSEALKKMVPGHVNGATYNNISQVIASLW